MPKAKAAKRNAIGQIRRLEQRLLNSEDHKERQRLAQQIHDIGIGHPLKSAERRAAANALLHAWEEENHLQTMKRTYLMVRNLRFKIKMSTRKAMIWAPTPEGFRKRREAKIEEYKITGPFPPRKAEKEAPEKKPKEEPEKEKPERKVAAKPKRRRTLEELGIRIPGAPISPQMLEIGKPTAEERKRYAESMRERKATGSVPVTREGRARKILARLPRATSEAGRKSQSMISEAELRRDALDRATIKERIVRPKKDYTLGGVIVPSLMPFMVGVGWDFTNKGLEASLKLAIFPISAALAIYHIVDTIDAEIEKANDPRRFKIPGTLPALPSEIKKKIKLSAIDIYILMGVADDPLITMRERKAAVVLLGEFKVKEAKPLLESIAQDPEEHGADRTLQILARMALNKIERGG